MDLPNKLASLKDKLDDVENRVGLLEKEIKKTVDVISSLGGKEVEIEKLSKRIDEESSTNKTKIKNIEEKVEEKLNSIFKDIEKVEEWLKENEEKKEKELNKKLSKLATKEEVEEIASKFSKIDKSLKEKIEHIDAAIERIKRTDEKLKETDKKLAETDKRLASIKVLQESFGKLKMDIAATEGELESRINEITKKIETLQLSVGKYPSPKELADRDLELAEKIRNIESRLGPDFEVVLDGFKKIKHTFAKKEDFENAIEELNERISSMESKIEAEDSTAEIAELKKDLEVLKQQVITTQDAIVELNAFIRQKMS